MEHDATSESMSSVKRFTSLPPWGSCFDAASDLRRGASVRVSCKLRERLALPTRDAKFSRTPPAT
jgi:hypothetical protein